jgi:hypothetical protein
MQCPSHSETNNSTINLPPQFYRTLFLKAKLHILLNTTISPSSNYTKIATCGQNQHDHGAYRKYEIRVLRQKECTRRDWARPLQHGHNVQITIRLHLRHDWGIRWRCCIRKLLLLDKAILPHDSMQRLLAANNMQINFFHLFLILIIYRHDRRSTMHIFHRHTLILLRLPIFQKGLELGQTVQGSAGTGDNFGCLQRFLCKTAAV